MCWSHSASVAFASVEASLILFISLRSRLSADPYVRKQWLLLPILISVCLVEITEAHLWTDQDLVSVTQANHHVCYKWNQRLTVLIWLFSQILLVIRQNLTIRQYPLKYSDLTNI